MADIAILWPANEDIQYPWEGNIELHQEILDHQKYVYWDSSPSRRKRLENVTGFIYNTAVGKVTHKCKVEKMIDRDELLKNPDEQFFVPYFRKQCLYGESPDEDEHEPSETWIKISKIEKLDSPKELKEFTKWKDEKSVERIRGGPVYIEET